ncbi:MULTISPECIES: lamin tail domain-containing protein [Haloferax]|uniref:MBL fold metallo-hydrolase n=1 Tax=Haloferax marinum TaxID=2666143 RepID=A0A6A8G9I7_9EURY|nr:MULTISPECIES: lamin tail domain-containing protein [Haloferax]KAB1198184.1 MBL fold metallo-hydrolase [Haloferax sp. CBA1150]MRW97268.1 MBL fold metallo-hydrolase [Haloferax marinum]
MSASFRTIAVVFLVLFAGCSGGGSGTLDTATGEPTTTAEEATTTQSPTTVTSLNGTLEVHFINVGQSVSTLLIAPNGETMLIDSGDFRDDGEPVLAYLQAHNIQRLDYLVTSHADADHIGGNAAIIEYYETEANGIGAIYDPGVASTSQTYAAYLDAVEKYDVPLYRTQAGDQIRMGQVTSTVLSPPEGYLASEDRNENSIVLMTQFGSTRFLFTGDAEHEAEEYMVDTYDESLRATVLKTGHHGSKGSTSEPFLQAVQPKIAVVSSDYDSQYGHPNEETLERLAAQSIPTYWTATHGTIVFASNGERVTISTQQEAPTSPTELRDGAAIEPGTGPDVTIRTEITAEGDVSTLTPIATDGGVDTETMSASLAVAEVHADAEGTESENLNDEYIVFENTGSNSIDLSGWTISDEAGRTYTVPGDTTLEAGATITLHTGRGTDTTTDLYWGSESAIWNNGGDTITVLNNTGATVVEEAYT